MESLAKRITYLQGMTDGLEIGENSKEGRIVSEMVLLLDDLFVEMKTLQLRMDESESYLEAVDCDLNNLELFVYDDDDLYEYVSDDDFVVMDEQSQEFYDLDDSEDAYMYTERPSGKTTAFNPT